MKKLAVFLASGLSNNPLFIQAIHDLAQLLAKEQVTLVYGGSSSGLMGELANAMLTAGGEVIGVFPECLRAQELPHARLTQLITVHSVSERITKMIQLADGFVALPGGLGTLEELFIVWNEIRLGFIHKPLGLLNIEQFYSPLLAFLQNKVQRENFLSESALKAPYVSENVSHLYNLMNLSLTEKI